MSATHYIFRTCSDEIELRSSLLRRYLSGPLEPAPGHLKSYVALIEVSPILHDSRACQVVLEYEHENEQRLRRSLTTPQMMLRATASSAVPNYVGEQERFPDTLLTVA